MWQLDVAPERADLDHALVMVCDDEGRRMFRVVVERMSRVSWSEASLTAIQELIDRSLEVSEFETVRNVSLRLRNVSFGLRRVSCRLRNASCAS